MRGKDPRTSPLGSPRCARAPTPKSWSGLCRKAHWCGMICQRTLQEYQVDDRWPSCPGYDVQVPLCRMRAAKIFASLSKHSLVQS